MATSVFRRPTSIFALVVILFVIVKTSQGASVHRRRAISTENTTTGNGVQKPACHGRTPCGWAVYKPFTRRFDYYMENTCDCPAGKVCLRTDDDLSVSAYVYTCRTEASSEKDHGDTETPA